MVQAEPGMFIGPIAAVFGYIIDFIFEIVHSITVYHSLGISIILLTVIVRSLMLPLAVKQQKSMMAMQRLNPEMQKIRAKYPDKKDQKSQQQMNAEIQQLYADNKVNPLGGCLPLVIQMPMFFGLSFIMHQSHLYVSRLGSLYQQISGYLINHGLEPQSEYVVSEMGELIANSPRNQYILTMRELATPITPTRMIENGDINFLVEQDVARVLNAFTTEQWSVVFDTISSQYMAGLMALYSQITTIESFFGMALTEATGLGWPQIMIPVLAVLSAVATSYVTMKASVITDERQKQQQRLMMMIMPVMMGVMTVGLPAGVGIFWITSSCYQIGQQLVMNKRMGIQTFPDKFKLPSFLQKG